MASRSFIAFVARRHTVEWDDAVEDSTGFYPALEDIRQQFINVRAHRAGPPAIVMLS